MAWRASSRSAFAPARFSASARPLNEWADEGRSSSLRGGRGRGGWARGGRGGAGGGGRGRARAALPHVWLRLFRAGCGPGGRDGGEDEETAQRSGNPLAAAVHVGAHDEEVEVRVRIHARSRLRLLEQRLSRGVGGGRARGVLGGRGGAVIDGERCAAGVGRRATRGPCPHRECPFRGDVCHPREAAHAP